MTTTDLTKTTDPATCTHEFRWRQMGGDARLWRCRTTGGFVGCNGAFVEGRRWLGEPEWIPVAEPIRCTNCLDGLCTSLDNDPCPACGAASTRPRTAEAEATR